MNEAEAEAEAEAGAGAEAEAASKVTVADVPGNSRYEARTTGTTVGFADYRRTAHAIVFVHTEVGGAFRGHGTAPPRRWAVTPSMKPAWPDCGWPPPARSSRGTWTSILSTKISAVSLRNSEQA
ncbi:hypothetical protein QF026_000200 [Streptomyces aurantiacus]|nr:hypothetical protein [Streptomyces aurantiacus]